MKMITTITEGAVTAYKQYLLGKGRSTATVAKYMHALNRLMAWLDERPLTDVAILEWRAYLAERLAPMSVNIELAALNGFLRANGRVDCCIDYLKVQRRVFRDESRDLTDAEYRRLVQAADKPRVALMLQTLCSTGIRVSELRYITVEAVRQGYTLINLKGKLRTVLLPERLCGKLKWYAKAERITAGPIFCTASGKATSRQQVWRVLKRLCEAADVPESKIYPHNLRHLFATTFYKETGNLVQLADVLGHSSIETTRIYLMTSGEEHRRSLDKLGLV